VVGVVYEDDEDVFVVVCERIPPHLFDDGVDPSSSSTLVTPIVH
jgi:hypothetical protein